MLLAVEVLLNYVYVWSMILSSYRGNPVAAVMPLCLRKCEVRHMSGTWRCDKLQSTKMELFRYCQFATSTVHSASESGYGDAPSTALVHDICWKTWTRTLVHADTLRDMKPSSTSSCRRRR